MAKQGSSFGIVMLIVVTAVVLLLVAQAWKELAPTALDADRAAHGASALDAHGENDAAQQLRSGEIPRMTEMNRETDAHAARVQNALTEAE